MKKNILAVFVVVIILLMLSLGSCREHALSEPTPTPEDFSANSSHAPQSQEASSHPTLSAAYQQLISDFRELVLERVNFENFDAAKWYENNPWLSHEIFHNGQEVSKERFGFALVDLNNNENPALALLLDDYTIIAIFSDFNNTPHLLDSFFQRCRAAITTDGYIHILGSSGAAVWRYDIKRLSYNDRELIIIESFVSNLEEQFREENGERHEMTDADMERFVLSNDDLSNEINRNSLTFIPLFE